MNMRTSYYFVDILRNSDQLGCLLIIVVIKTQFLKAMKYTTSNKMCFSNPCNYHDEEVTTSVDLFFNEIRVMFYDL